MALFGLSLQALILSLMSFDLATLPARIWDRLPRRGIAAVFGFTAAFLALYDVYDVYDLYDLLYRNSRRIKRDHPGA